MAAHVTLHSSKGVMVCSRDFVSRSDRCLHIMSWLAHHGSTPARRSDSINNCAQVNTYMQQVGLGGIPSITVAPGRGQTFKPLQVQSQLPAEMPGRQNGGSYGGAVGNPQQEHDRIWANNIWTAGDPPSGEQAIAA